MTVLSHRGASILSSVSSLAPTAMHSSQVDGAGLTLEHRQVGANDPFKLVGTVVEKRYLVEEVVGHGGFGVVYRARHLGFDAPVAIKVLKLPQDLPEAKRRTFIESFVLEGRVLFELSNLHHAIARALETGSVPAGDRLVAPYLIMEWLEGEVLAAELRKRLATGLPTYTVLQAMDLLADPADALAAAHARGIAHRDVKPSNIFLARRAGRVCPKLLDFGLAKIVGDSPSITSAGPDSIGEYCPFTPGYAAPEQWLQRLGRTGPWTDVHALALVMVEMVIGRAPFGRGSTPELMAACLDGTIRPTPGTLGCKLSAATEAVFARALALDPRERFRHVGQFWTALGGSLQTESAMVALRGSKGSASMTRRPSPGKANSDTGVLANESKSSSVSHQGVRAPTFARLPRYLPLPWRFLRLGSSTLVCGMLAFTQVGRARRAADEPVARRAEQKKQIHNTVATLNAHAVASAATEQPPTVTIQPAATVTRLPSVRRVKSKPAPFPLSSSSLSVAEKPETSTADPSSVSARTLLSHEELQQRR